MKNISVILFVFAVLFGCESETSFGKCIGINDERDPSLHYKVSTTNVVIGIVFIETVFAPAIVVLDELYCPISKSKQ